MLEGSIDPSPSHLLALLKQHWGYDAFRQLQQETIEAIAGRRDSLTILPTGGGKSLCYQLPALLFEGQTAVIVSPLIALMKDQVDQARTLGISAEAFNSSCSSQEQREIYERFQRGETRLLYVSPERLAVPEFLETLQQSERISFFAVDEAHCVSQWGHDFRPEYRTLSRLRHLFPDTAVHAFTATATPQVQQDILNSLNLRDPLLLVGSFDRPNLRYAARQRPSKQEHFLAALAQEIDTHRNQAGIIYCISRAEVDQLSAELAGLGHSVLPYHAGLSDETRRANQEAFMSEAVDIVVATVAFGMGIDRSNIRYVIHSGMPKSLEHYQQEAGRAGRDGLDADCILFYGGRDVPLWFEMIRKSSPENRSGSLKKLDEMAAYCHTLRCRHRVLLEYFGQTDATDCKTACDICLEARPVFAESLVTAQKILSCVWRVGQSQNATYINKVLKGTSDEKIRENDHESLSTFGLLKQHDKKDIATWIDQLVSQRLLVRSGPYAPLRITSSGQQVFKATAEAAESLVKLSPPAPKTLAKAPWEGKSKSRSSWATRAQGEDWDEPYSGAPGRSGGRRRFESAYSESPEWDAVKGYVDSAPGGDDDERLFETLRHLRRTLSMENKVPAYIICGDVSLREMVRLKPTTPDALLAVRGMGQRKVELYGEMFLNALREHQGLAPLRR